jgi:hypothetical protein
MLFSFFITLFGFVFAFRISARVIAQNLFSKSTMTKIGTVCICMQIACVLLFARSYFMLWLMTGIPLLLLLCWIFVVKKIREKKFRRNFLEALAVIILKMKSGKAFRHSFSEVIQESEPYMRQKLSEIRDFVVFSQQAKLSLIPTSFFVQQIVNEFILVDRTPHSALKRLSVLRSRIRLEDDFRRKSGQVVHQIRAQSLLMTGLYIAVALFIVQRFGLQKNLSLFALSLILFISGMIWIYFGGRRLKWKV